MRRGDLIHIAWIPLEFAVLNKYIKLQIDKQWEDGWQVIAVGKVKLEQETLLERSQDYKRTRKASDI